jgi:3-hydroxyisobutyrate dehydrogenase-like beta-hydroxyacid dehydrogenase
VVIMSTIAFLGLGGMGLPMARRLLSTDHALVVWNRSPERADALVDLGARAASSPAEASREAEVVITLLADPAAVTSVLLGDSGVVKTVRPGTLVIEMSTIGPSAVAANSSLPIVRAAYSAMTAAAAALPDSDVREAVDHLSRS